MCHTPRVKPNVTFSNRVGLKVCVSLMANRCALVQFGPPSQGSVKFLKQLKELPWLYCCEYFTLIKLLFVETVVDLDVELVVVALVGAGSNPVVVNAVARNVRLREELIIFCATGSIRLPGTPGGWLKVGRQVGAARD